MIVHHDSPAPEPTAAFREEEPAEAPMKKRHKITLLLAGMVILTAVLVLAYFIFLANSSTKGTVELVKPPPANAAPAPDLTLKGSYVRFNYGSTYISQNSQTTVPNALEQHVLLSNGFGGKQIAVVVAKLVEGSLEEYGSYKFRSVHPETYNEKPLHITGSTGSIMEKNDGTEVTAFIIKGDIIATISMTATSDPSNKVDLDAEMTKLLGTFSWVQ